MSGAPDGASKESRMRKSMSGEMDEILAFVAHELRTPLTAIAGWAQLLQRSPLSDESRRAVDAIARNAAAQSRLIEDLLDHSQLVGGTLRLERETVELGEIARNAAEAVRIVAAERRIEFELRGGSLSQWHASAPIQPPLPYATVWTDLSSPLFHRTFADRENSRTISGAYDPGSCPHIRKCAPGRLG
jgi:signal transduction histidine kinase